MKYCDQHVCLPTSTHISPKAHVHISPNFLCVLLAAIIERMGQNHVLSIMPSCGNDCHVWLCCLILCHILQHLFYKERCWFFCHGKNYFTRTGKTDKTVAETCKNSWI